MESMPVPEEAERTFGKGKAHDADASPAEVEEVPRMCATKDGKISLTGERPSARRKDGNRTIRQ